MNIAFLPARGGSKSIRHKNIKKFCGKPLIFWSLEALQKTNAIDKVFVATDSEEISEIVKSFKFSKVNIFKRSSKNASDGASTESVMLEFLKENFFNESDLLVLVQATSPFTQHKDFEKAIKTIKQKGEGSMLSCAIVKRFFWSESGIPINYDYKDRPRRQDFKGTLMENGAFYISFIKDILRSKNRISGNIIPYKMRDFTGLEIDEEDDWVIAETLMKKYIINENKKNSIRLFLSDVDGTLTDASMYYCENGDESKKFNTHDGMGFEILKDRGVKVGMVTSEKNIIVVNRAKKLNVDFLGQGLKNEGKLNYVKEICKKEGISLQETAYIGDDINCKEILENIGFPACPANAVLDIKSIPGIIKLEKKGGDGVVREYIEFLINQNYII